MWIRGFLALIPGLLHSGQLEALAAIEANPRGTYVLEIARRWGKTFLLVVIAFQVCLRKPGARVVYGAPTLKHLEEFVLPAIEKVSNFAPAGWRPHWNGTKGHLEFPNGSYVHLFGADDKRKADRGRGPEADLCIFDEAGFCPLLRYVIRSVLRPQLLHTQGRILLGSTPSEEPDHDFTAMAERAESNGLYFNQTVWENPRLTEEQIQTFVADDAKDEGMSPEEYMETDDFRREYLAERVINKLLVVLPEWDAAEKDCLVAIERPAFFNAQTILDFGGVDPHAVQLGYWHFEKALYVVEDELLLRKGENTAELVKAVQDKERDLYGTKLWDGTLRVATEDVTEAFLQSIPDWMADIVRKATPKVSQPFARWCDNNIQLARDIYQLHQTAFIPTAKDNKELQVNNVRVMLRERRILIHPRCVHTRRHLRGTTWKDHKRKEFARKNGEHGDLVDTLCYGVRNLDKRNPDTEPKTDILGRRVGPKPVSLIPNTRLGRKLSNAG